MTSEEFYKLSPVEFYYALQDNQKLEESKFQMVFESMRRQTHVMWNLQVSKKDKIPDLHKFMPLPWDKIIPQTIEDHKNAILGIRSFIKSKKKNNGLKHR